jgi:hypothetical protein
MSQVSNLGDSLFRFLNDYFPEYIEGFLPGLPLEVIESKLNSLAQALPDDFYDLYSWRNGSSEYFPQPFPSGDICQFNPLDTVVEEMEWEWFEGVLPLYKNYPVLPFITIDSEFIAIVLSRSYSEEAHIAYIDEEGDAFLYGDSITAVLESTIECFLSHAVVADDSGCFEENITLSSKIWRDKNPCALRELMLDLNSALGQLVSDVEQAAGIEDESYAMTIKILVSTLRALKRFQPPEAVSSVRSCLSILKESPSEKMRGLEFTLEQWLKEINCVSS